MSNSLTGYRPDIDGLRALAVVAVILFHGRVPGFSGGYIGVDVFFVISGYLITRQLIGMIDQPLGQLLTNFYLRRARRILPALMLIIAATLAAGAALLLPRDFANLGEAAALSVIMLGNLAAWMDGAYFNAGIGQTALFHLWTIAIEEQFYLAFPIVLCLARKRLSVSGSSILLASFAGLSFVACVYASEAHPSANFYFAPTRAWELLLGALLAMHTIRIDSRLSRELLSLAAVTVLVSANVLFGEETRYPSHFTLVPCIATAVLIVTGTSNPSITRSLLSLRPVVFIGLMSYSLYLWHVPLLMMLEYYAIEPLSAYQTLAWLAATAAFAYVSWALVETPIRKRSLLNSDKRFIASVATVGLTLAVIGSLVWVADGLPNRFSPAILEAIEGEYGFHADAERCLTLSQSQLANGDLCKFGSDEPFARRALLWGDSHALALLPAFESLANEYDITLYFAATSSCRPLLGLRHVGQRIENRERCQTFNSAVLSAIAQIDPAIIILSSFWTYPSMHFASEGEIGLSADDAFAGGLRQTLARSEISGRDVCLVLDVPQFDYFVPRAFSRAVIKGTAMESLSMDRADAAKQLAPAEIVFEQFAATGEIQLVDPKESLCSETICRAVSPTGRPLYRDDHHLSVYGASFVQPSLERCFQ